jgi:hypothetical protein
VRGTSVFELINRFEPTAAGTFTPARLSIRTTRLAARTGERTGAVP